MIRASLTLPVWIVTIAYLAINVSSYGIDIGSMTWTQRSDWINVKNCTSITGVASAGGQGGATDDTAAIQAALDVISGIPIPGGKSNPNPGGKYRVVYFPPGIYNISQTLIVGNNPNQQNGLAIIGSGGGGPSKLVGTTIQWTGAAGPAMCNPQYVAGILFKGLVWDGMNLAGCGYEHHSPMVNGNTPYDGNVRHDTESFRNFTHYGTYAPNDPGSSIYGYPAGENPPAAIAGEVNDGADNSVTADSMIYNCKFSNCTFGFFCPMDQGQPNVCWLVDSCEFDNCSGTAVDFQWGNMCTVMNTHFSGNGEDIRAEGNVTVRHCTSQGSTTFLLDWGGGSSSMDVVEDCAVDTWKNVTRAIEMDGFGGYMMMDCSFTNPPSGAAGVVEFKNGWGWLQQVTVSNNYAQGFNGMAMINSSSLTNYPLSLLTIPEGTRLPSLTTGVKVGVGTTSAATTFLNTAAFNDVPASKILDVGPPSGGDDSPAIQAAITTAASNSGDIVYIPDGVYNLYEPLTATGGTFSIQSTVPQGAELCWRGADGASVLTLTNPTNVTVSDIWFAVLDATVAAITQTGGSGSTVYQEVSYGSYQAGNLRAYNGGDFSSAPGIVLSNIPSGSSVFLDHCSSSLNVKNSSAANVTSRFQQFTQNGNITVSGTSAKTGIFGLMFSELVPGSGYTFNVNDNQDFITLDQYTEEGGNDIELSRGAGTGTGRVTVQGFQYQSFNVATQVNINNYAGNFFLGPEILQNNQNGSTPVSVVQTGSNPVNMIFAENHFMDSYPTFNLGAGANLMLEEDEDNNSSTSHENPYANTPGLLTGQDLLGFTTAMDHIRQLEAVDLKNRFGITTDAPPVVSYAFENDTTDQIGNANGVNHNVAFTMGEVGADAGSFNGTNAYVDLQNPSVLPTGKSAITLCAWANSPGLASGQLGMIENVGTTNTDQAIWIGADGTSLAAGGWNDNLTEVPNFWDGNWHFIVLTYDGTTAKLYADGLQKQSAAKSINIVRAGAYLGSAGAGGNFWKGSIDQAQIYNYTLSAADITYRYNHGRANSPLVAYLRLDEASGSTSADSTGDGVTGTWANSPVPTTDHPSQISVPDSHSLSFNGTNQYVTLNNLAALPTSNAPRTLSAWAKATTTTGNHFIASYGSPSTNQAFLIGHEGTTLDAGGYNNDMQVPNAFTDQNWHLVTLTYDGNTESLYFDGVLRAQQSIFLNTVVSSGMIGELVGGVYPFQGNIDDVRVYNRCLTAAEVGSIYGLVAYWTLDETAGPTTYDSSGNNIDGVWVNGPAPSTDKPGLITFTDPRSLSFSASGSQYVNFGTPSQLPSGQSPRTICGWAKNLGLSGYGMFASYGTPANHEGFWIGGQGTSLVSGAWGDDMATIPNFWDGNWHFICLTYDGTTAKLYADGVLKDTETKTWNLVPDVCYVGAYLNTACFWNGPVDDVRIYNRALSQAEVSRLAAGNP